MTLNVNNFSQEDLDKARSVYESAATDLAFPFYRFLRKLENIKETNQSNIDYEFIQKKVNTFKKFIERFSTNLSSFYMDNPEYITFWIKDSTILEEMEELEALLLDLESRENINYELDLDRVILKFDEVYQVYLTAKRIADREDKANRLIEELTNQVEEAKDSVRNLKSARLALEGQKTEEIYSEASLRYLESARNYEWTFYLIFIAAIIVTIVSFIHFPYSTTDIVDFILYKVLTVSVVITFGTIFLRKASHLRKLHDQAHQTSMELQALPLYLKNVKSDDHSEIYKNLAEKYFGKEIDQTQNDKIGDLMQDQLAAGTELIKASAELVKSVKPSGASESSEPK